jgi:hypothetical protein
MLFQELSCADSLTAENKDYSQDLLVFVALGELVININT